MIECDPTASAAVVKVAVVTPSVVLSVPVPSVVEPSMNVTVPVGGTRPGARVDHRGRERHRLTEDRGGGGGGHGDRRRILRDIERQHGHIERGRARAAAAVRGRGVHRRGADRELLSRW